jgi:hypothetical protein
MFPSLEVIVFGGQACLTFNVWTLFYFFACLFRGRWCNQSRWKVNLVIDTKNNLNPTREWRYVYVEWITNLLYFNSVRLENENSNAFLYCLQATERKEYWWDNILIRVYIHQDATLHSLFYLDTALGVSGGTSTHHQERKQLYLQHLVFVTPLLLPAANVTHFILFGNCSTCFGW